MSTEACPNCTAPREAGAVVCKFCKTPLVRDIQAEAVQCPQCKEYSDIRATNCVKCKACVVVKCIFCGGLSPHHYPACAHCREVFSGAAERWQARKDAAESQQRMQMLSGVGSVAAAFLGAAAGVALTDSNQEHSAGRHSHGRRRRHQYADDSSGSSGSSDSSGSWTDIFNGDDSNNSGGGSSDDGPSGGGGGNLMDSDLTGGSDDDNG